MDAVTTETLRRTLINQDIQQSKRVKDSTHLWEDIVVPALTTTELADVDIIVASLKSVLRDAETPVFFEFLFDKLVEFAYNENETSSVLQEHIYAVLAAIGAERPKVDLLKCVFVYF